MGDLLKIYQKLFKRFGPQHWWPASTRFEVIIGAILTQNTNWGNVEKALKNLKDSNLLSPDFLYKIPASKLALKIRPSGYFNIKAKRIRNFLKFLFREFDGRLSLMAKEPKERLRKKLLTVNGIGEETADSILLYAFEKPSFVVDAYTKRILYRHGLIGKAWPYQRVQSFFEDRLKSDTGVFNEYHALMVRLAKDHCRPTPDCRQCPINHVNYSIHNRCGKCFRTLLHQLKRTETLRGRKITVCLDCRD